MYFKGLHFCCYRIHWNIITNLVWFFACSWFQIDETLLLGYFFMQFSKIKINFLDESIFLKLFSFKVIYFLCSTEGLETFFLFEYRPILISE